MFHHISVLLQETIDGLNIKEDDVAVYGDSGNDLVMLEAFKNSYAPKNASKEAKIKAGHIIGPYDEYSVIEHMLRTIDED